MRLIRPLTVLAALYRRRASSALARAASARLALVVLMVYGRGSRFSELVRLRRVAELEEGRARAWLRSARRYEAA